ncbi:MAG: hypothetical protein HY681_01715 [Chloroflexi bacterium]|nr:hypothetical protein [Chloroflexota bacterium]
MATQRTVQPMQAEWSRLYSQASRFRQLAPWQWLTDDRFIAVEEPETGDTAYCVVMGAGGIEYGLLAYRGAVGFKGYLLVANEAVDEDESMFIQDCLSLSFGDRELVDKADRAIHAALGLKFRGRGQWPLFRSHRGVYFPTRLDQQEAKFLATCLEQVCGFVEEGQSGRPLPSPTEERPLVGRRRNRAGTWETTVFPLPPQPPLPTLAIERGRVDAALAKCAKTRQTWQARVETAGIIDEGKGTQPFFARILMCVEAKSGFILPGDVLEPEESVQEGLMSAVEESGVIPHALNVTSPYLQGELAPLAEALGIKVSQVTRMKNLDEASEALKAAVRRS